MSVTPKILSYGGGLDSFAMLLDAQARGELPDLCVFADVGDGDAARDGEDPGEWPGTYRHIREVVAPLCASLGVEFVWLDSSLYPIRGSRSLFAYFEDKHLIPGRQSRLCTSAAKVERIADFIERRFPGQAVEVWVGFEAGEEKRAENDPHAAGRKSDRSLRTNRFPLVERGLCRCRCEAIVRAAGYAIPRKSACVYCPFSTRGDFQTLQRELPAAFARVEALEDNCRTSKAGKTMRFGYEKGDGTDPALAAWASKPYTRKLMPCKVCGAAVRASKATGCDYLEPAGASC